MDAGKVVVIISKSDSGKSTLLGVIAGLTELDDPELRIDGHHVRSDIEDTDNYEQGIRGRHGVPELHALTAHERPGEPHARAPQGPEHGHDRGLEPGAARARESRSPAPLPQSCNPAV